MHSEVASLDPSSSGGPLYVRIRGRVTEPIRQPEAGVPAAPRLTFRRWRGRQESCKRAGHRQLRPHCCAIVTAHAGEPLSFDLNLAMNFSESTGRPVGEKYRCQAAPDLVQLKSTPSVSGRRSTRDLIAGSGRQACLGSVAASTPIQMREPAVRSARPPGRRRAQGWVREKPCQDYEHTVRGDGVDGARVLALDGLHRP